MRHFQSWSRPRAKAHGVTGNIAVAALTLLQLAVFQNSGAHAQEAVFPDFPFRIECEAGGTHHAYYLTQVDSAGIATYATLAGQSGTITLTGKVEQAGGDTSSSCAGKTLEQLRSSGQAFYMHP